MDSEIIDNGAGCFPWTKCFVMLPRRSIKGKLLFFKWVYKRRVWLIWGRGFHMEPEDQYADIFEILELKK
jgi:hypothetical protein